MFTSALKSFNSNISANYTLSANPTSISGPWKIYDATKKTTGKAVSVFVFDRKFLEPHPRALSSRSGPSVKRAQEEVIERLKKEASSLARLRHPSILELAESVEETRYGSLMFATEPVTSSLSELLQERDDQERAGGVGGRSSRYVVEDNGGRRRREVEIDELEIQKGLLQIGRGLEFLHESAGLVHGNLTPDGIYINAKSDWKISGLGFSGPPDNSNTPSSVPSIPLAEVLQQDPRLPRSVQLNLDFSSPDFVLDSNVTPAADLFSLGLLIVSLYNSPHASPLHVNSNTSTYKKIFASSSSIPSQSNNFLSSRPLPKEIVASVLPGLMTRRPAQRLGAREFQETQYFDNLLVSTIRFLDSLPAKTPNEKAQFMRGLSRILTQFPRSVLEKKILPALLEEMKDPGLLSLILQNVFRIVKTLPRRAFSEKVIPSLREVFLSSGTMTTERNLAKEAGLTVVLDHMSTIADICSGKEFKDDILPIIKHGIESPTHPLIDASLRSVPIILPILDFSTLKNELFPVIAAVFSKTSSLGIKVRGLEAFAILCGWPREDAATGGGGFDGGLGMERNQAKSNGSAVLDKYTIQEKIVPLLKAIKTKEPAVIMAALNVFKQVGKIADSDFLAMDVLPILWSFSLGPLLNLQQFKEFMDVIKSLSNRIEKEQSRKLEELSSNSTSASGPRSHDTSIFGLLDASGEPDRAKSDEGGFERLVLGKKSEASTGPPNRSIGVQDSVAPAFAWSTAPSGALSGQMAASRAITPDQNLSSFAALTPSTASSSSFTRPLSSANGWSAQRASSNAAVATRSTMT
ncbi:MAG: hypothetical protein M1830_009225, partial [Pleopsidium flavum]